MLRALSPGAVPGLIILLLLPTLALAGTLTDEVTRFFEEDDWTFQKDELNGDALLLTRVSGDNGNWQCAARIDEEMEQVMFYSILDNKVPEGRRTAMAEFLTRANYGLHYGNFEMDFSDGEIRVKTSVDVEGGKLAPTMIKNLVYLNVKLMDKYLPGVNRVAFGDADPEVAVKEIEDE